MRASSILIMWAGGISADPIHETYEGQLSGLSDDSTSTRGKRKGAALPAKHGQEGEEEREEHQRTNGQLIAYARPLK